MMKTPFVKSLQRARGWCDRAVSRLVGHPFGADSPNAARQSKRVRPAALRRTFLFGDASGISMMQCEWYHGRLISRLMVARRGYGAFLFPLGKTVFYFRFL